MAAASTLSLEGRTALVTGAAQGLGAAIAKALYDEGANALLADVNLGGAGEVAGRLDPEGRRAVAREVDVRDRGALASAFDDAAERWGSVDILVNNAALTIGGSFWEIPADEWDQVMAVNLRGVFFGCQIAGPRMRSQGWGRIINLASLAGQQGGLVAGAHYAASKAGIVVLTKIVASELAKDGVTVNAIAPAAISGPMMDSLPPELIQSLPSRIPVGRVGRPDEVAALVVFLCSDAAAYMTGTTVDLNGGVFMR